MKRFLPIISAVIALSASNAVAGSPQSANKTQVATQAEAEAGTDNKKMLTALRAAQQVTARIAAQAEAEAFTDNTKIMTPLRVNDWFNAKRSTTAAAQNGTQVATIMTPARTVEAIRTYGHYPAGVHIGAAYCEDASYLATAGTMIPDDDTIPQQTEGDEILTCAYAAKVSGSKLRIHFEGFAAAASDDLGCALFVDSGAGAVNASSSNSQSAGIQALLAFTTEITTSDTSSHTYKVRCARLGNNNPMYFNGSSTGRRLGGSTKTKIWIEEIKQ